MATSPPVNSRTPYPRMWARLWALVACIAALFVLFAALGERSLLIACAAVSLFALAALAWIHLREATRLARAFGDSESRFRALTKSIPNILFIYDLTRHEIIYSNNDCSEILGLSPEALRRTDLATLSKKLHPDDTKKYSGLSDSIAALPDGEALNIECRICDAAGAWRWLSLRVIVFARTQPHQADQVLVAGHDVTALRDAQDNVRQLEKAALSKQRLALLGELSASVAHEFRNPLLGVRHCVEDLRIRCAPDTSLTSTIGLLEEGIMRMDHISERLLRLARSETGDMLASDLAQCIEGTCAFILSRAQKHGVVLHSRVQPGLPPVLMHSERISEALLNLINNAIDACKPGGSVTISAALAPARRDYIQLEITDTGHGIPAELRPKVFDAFFTTKPAGKGTGLGMTIVKRIVDAHGGQIELGDAEKAGTTFRIFLPVATLTTAGKSK